MNGVRVPIVSLGPAGNSVRGPPGIYGGSCVTGAMPGSCPYESPMPSCVMPAIWFVNNRTSPTIAIIEIAPSSNNLFCIM